MAMAMQSGIGISKVLFIAGAGYTGTILIKNGKLSDIIGELQSLVKGMEKYGDQNDDDGDMTDAIAAQVRRLANEVRQIASNRSITVLNGGGQSSNLSSLVVPATVLGVAGYGYMKFKGLSFSDLMYVTKRNMEAAVADLTKKLQHASDVIADAKKHLTQRIQNLDDKMRKQNEKTRLIQDGVSDVRKTVTNIHDDMSDMKLKVAQLDGRLNKVGENQELANMGLDYIIGFIQANTRRVPDSLPGTISQEQPKLPWRSPGMLTLPGITYPGTPNLMGLKDIAESLSSLDRSASDTIGLDKLEQQRKPLLRCTSTKC
ncbi:unnamed protein product [Lathyrus oleraceus]|uniref:DUF1664 domain-containing protein n=1 Tax=Pisum sativum TaxID=3888 RepID=A0A9D5BCK9_PEA|nr:uncharacterized protein LOC127119892 [Pisum sativum]KAI5438336.1 hypothetical protein KIW84_024174 [Pisum sativum]